MSLTWKIILPLAIIVIGAATISLFKNNSVVPFSQTSPTSESGSMEKKSYNQNAQPLTDADIDLMIKYADTESPADAEEEKDSALVNSDKDSFNNYDSAYVSTDF